MIAIADQLTTCGVNVSNEAFWLWVRDEMQARGMNYADFAEKGGKSASNRSTIWNAINKGQDLTLPMVAMVARAFGMSRIAVLRKAGFLAVTPKDLDDASLEFLELLEAAKHIPKEDQALLTKMLRSVVKDA